MKFFKKKIVFLIFRNNYRLYALGNFAKTNFYKNYIIINLSGRIKSKIGKFFYDLKLGNFISLDGDPFLNNQKNSINIWYTGTKLRITSKYTNFKNNFVNMINPAIIDNDKLFHLYPIVKKRKIEIRDNRKIIFMGNCFFQPDKKNFFTPNRLLELKKEILSNFKTIEEKKFWDDRFKKEELSIKFDNYKIIKTYLRAEILNKINKEFKNDLFVYGTSSIDNKFQTIKPVYDLKKVREIYSGNICIDTGSIFGSATFNPRSIQILESGGILLQTYQQDSREKLKEIYDEVSSNNINLLIEKIDRLLTNYDKCIEIMNKTEKFLINSRKNISNSLDKVFNN